MPLPTMTLSVCVHTMNQIMNCELSLIVAKEVRVYQCLLWKVSAPRTVLGLAVLHIWFRDGLTGTPQACVHVFLSGCDQCCHCSCASGSSDPHFLPLCILSLQTNGLRQLRAPRKVLQFMCPSPQCGPLTGQAIQGLPTIMTTMSPATTMQHVASTSYPLPLLTNPVAPHT